MNRQSRTWLLIVLIALGFAARIGLLCVSQGSIEALLWEHFGSLVIQLGLHDVYIYEPYLNHPPVAVLIGGAVSWLSSVTHLSFAFLFRVPAILADAIVCVLLYKVYRTRGGKNGIWLGLTAAAAFAWNLDALLISAICCNADAIYVALCIVALWLADNKQRPLAAGLVLGLAINIKLLPGMFVLPVLLLSRSWREFARLMAGLAIMALPYLFMLVYVGYAFRVHVLMYRPVGGSGLSDIILALEPHPLLRHYVRGMFDRYADVAKPLVMMATALPALAMRRRADWNRWRAAAMAGVLFSVISPGFAVHYTALVGAVFMAYDLRAGAIWCGLSGLQLLTHYLFLWDGSFPILAVTPQGGAGPSKYFEMLAWGWALLWLIREIRREKPLTSVPDAVSVPPGRT